MGIGAAAVIGIGLFYATGGDPLDPMYQTGTTDVIAGGGIAPADVSGDEWHHWGSNVGGQRYSPLDLLTPANVAGLKPAWTVNVGGGVGNYVEKLETTPLKIGDSLYACTGYNDVLSIDAETGHVNWRYRHNPDKKAVDSRSSAPSRAMRSSLMRCPKSQSNRSAWPPKLSLSEPASPWRVGAPAMYVLEVAVSIDEGGRLRRRRELLTSLRATRKTFARAGDVKGAMRIELGIQLLLDQRVSDRMIDLLTQSAAIAARDAAELATPGAA